MVFVLLWLKKWYIMLGKVSEITQHDMFSPLLKDFIDPSHELVLLADTIDWQYFEEEFKQFYCANNGAPEKSIQQMLWIAYKIYYLCDRKQPTTTSRPRRISCELLTKFIIFAIGNNEKQI